MGRYRHYADQPPAGSSTEKCSLYHGLPILLVITLLCFGKLGLLPVASAFLLNHVQVEAVMASLLKTGWA